MISQLSKNNSRCEAIVKVCEEFFFFFYVHLLKITNFMITLLTQINEKQYLMCGGSGIQQLTTLLSTIKQSKPAKLMNIH